MARSSSAARDQGSDDFDAASQLAILRRAVAGIVLPGKHLPAELAAIRTTLRRFCGLAQVMLESQQVARVSELHLRLARGLPNRALLEVVRGELYDCLVRASAVAPLEPMRAIPGDALSMRASLSDFCDALLPWTADSRDVWPLTVAAAELSLLLGQPGARQWPRRERARLLGLANRARRWRARGGDAAGAAELHAELGATLDLLESLNQRPEVRRHDERVLRELGALLSRPAHDLSVAVSAAEGLAALRGLDRELDRLIVALPLEPMLSLDGIARRVRKLSLARLVS